MGQILHGGATTTEAIRRAIQSSQGSLRALSKHYGINQKTVAKWKKRGSVADLPTGPKDPHSSVLSLDEEAIVVAFRKHTLLPLDDCLYAFQPTLPRLSGLVCPGIAAQPPASTNCRLAEALVSAFNSVRRAAEPGAALNRSTQMSAASSPRAMFPAFVTRPRDVPPVTQPP